MSITWIFCNFASLSKTCVNMRFRCGSKSRSPPFQLTVFVAD